MNSAILPSGTYRYAIHSEGDVTATSSVVVARNLSSVTISETLDLSGETVKTTRVLDPTTFATLSWSGPGEPKPETITITRKNGTYRHGDTSTTLAAPADAPAAVFDFFVAEFVALPAMIHAAGAARYIEYCLCIVGFEVKTVSVSAAPAPRPAGALPGDVSITIGPKGEATLWYDPQTFILRELDVPSERIAYVRI